MCCLRCLSPESRHDWAGGESGSRRAGSRAGRQAEPTARRAAHAGGERGLGAGAVARVAIGAAAREAGGGRPRVRRAGGCERAAPIVTPRRKRERTADQRSRVAGVARRDASRRRVPRRVHASIRIRAGREARFGLELCAAGRELTAGERRALLPLSTVGTGDAIAGSRAQSTAPVGEAATAAVLGAAVRRKVSTVIDGAAAVHLRSREEVAAGLA